MKPNDTKNSHACPYFRTCGGCDYIDMPYEEQLKVKTKSVVRELGEIARSQKCEIEPIVPAKDPLYYRNKVHSVFAKNRKGQIIRGIYREDSHEVVSVRGCMLENRLADEIIEEIKRLLPSFKLKVFDEDTGYGWLRHVLVRVAHKKAKPEDKMLSEEVMVVLVTSEVMFPGKNNFIKALRTKFPQVSTIVQNINAKKTSMVLGERNIVLFGKGFVEDDSLGLRFRISPSSFFQINTEQTVKLYSLALEMAGLSGDECVLDAYCGTGTIGMFMSSKAHDVIGVELNSDAVRDARNNAKTNRITNITFANTDSTKYLTALIEAGEAPHIDCLCMDPPRSGSTEEFIHAAAKLGIPKVVYVSCNPTTLARDLKVFIKDGYKLKRAVPVDMFPQTTHVETVCLLSKLHEAKEEAIMEALRHYRMI